MIFTIGPGGCGFTFINWSIVFLRGDNFYKNLNGSIVPVNINPLNGSTAHNFSKDHLRIQDPRSELLQNCDDSSIIYMVPQNRNDFEYILSLPGKKIIFDHCVEPQELFARSCITMPEPYNVYTQLINNLSNRYPKQQVIEVLLDLGKKIIQTYDVPPGYYTLNYNQIFKTLDDNVAAMMDYLELTIDRSRINRWQEIYDMYRENNKNFVQRLRTVDCIPNHRYKTQILKEVLEWMNGQYHR